MVESVMLEYYHPLKPTREKRIPITMQLIAVFMASLVSNWNVTIQRSGQHLLSS